MYSALCIMQPASSNEQRATSNQMIYMPVEKSRSIHNLSNNLHLSAIWFIKTLFNPMLSKKELVGDCKN